MNTCSTFYLTVDFRCAGCRCKATGKPFLYVCEVINHIDQQPLKHLLMPLVFLSLQFNLSMEDETESYHLMELLKKSITLN